MTEGYAGEQTLVTLAWPADADRLQRLLERCSDYYELHEGVSTPPDAGAHELTAVPPASAQEDLHVLAFQDAGGVLQAMVQLFANCPARGTWWIGLLVVAPEHRGRGIGAALLRHAIEAASADGASVMRLAVSVENPRGQRFWAAAGFQSEGLTQEVTARSGYIDTVRIYQCRLPVIGDPSRG